MKKTYEPITAGYWVVTTDDGKLIIWGKDGDVKEPFINQEEAMKQADVLSQEFDSLYILKVFSNGCIKTYEYN